jgi:hypothetical protein
MPDDRVSASPASARPASPPEGSGATAETLLRMLYVTAVYGAECFAYMLETYAGLTPEHRRKLEACRRLELAMSQRLMRHLTDDLGLTVKPPARARQAAKTLVTLQHASWFDRMAEIEGAAIRGVAAGRTLKAIHGDREPNLCAVLMAREMALRDFARDEMDDEPEFSIDRVLALLSPEDRAAVARPL